MDSKIREYHVNGNGYLTIKEAEKYAKEHNSHEIIVFVWNNKESYESHEADNFYSIEIEM